VHLGWILSICRCTGRRGLLRISEEYRSLCNGIRGETNHGTQHEVG
jgi:hypothetical protein